MYVVGSISVDDGSLGRTYMVPVNEAKVWRRVRDIMSDNRESQDHINKAYDYLITSQGCSYTADNRIYFVGHLEDCE